MTKPQLVKVEALFYVLQQVIKRSCAYFDTAPFAYMALGCVVILHGLHPLLKEAKTMKQ